MPYPVSGPLVHWYVFSILFEVHLQDLLSLVPMSHPFEIDQQSPKKFKVDFTDRNIYR